MPQLELRQIWALGQDAGYRQQLDVCVELFDEADPLRGWMVGAEGLEPPTSAL